MIRLSTEANKFKGETVRRDRCVAMADLEEIVALAAEVGFGSFEEHYRADGVTGLWTKSISMRVPNGIKTVEAYGPEEMAKEEGNRDMAGFVALWERIHRQALYTWSPKG